MPCCTTNSDVLYMSLLCRRGYSKIETDSEESAAVIDMQALGREALRLLRCIGEHNPGLLADFLKAGAGASAQGRVSTCGLMISLSLMTRGCPTHLLGCAELALGNHGVGAFRMVQMRPWQICRNRQREGLSEVCSPKDLFCHCRSRSRRPLKAAQSSASCRSA